MNAAARNAVSSSIHKYPYRWHLTDLANVKPNGRKIFSCFSCGGGSSMGYKLAGYQVIGNCEIDPGVAAMYKANHHPMHSFNLDVRDFLSLEEYPTELYNLDILDGSPPCSVFSTAGSREKAWGKEKVFREGQKKQTLDDLFFTFIAIAKKLQPKVIVAENVTGLVKGNAKGYVTEILRQLDKAGYVTQLFLLNAAYMGVPQKRERVFFISQRKDIFKAKISISVNEQPILFGEYREEHGEEPSGAVEREMIQKRQKGDRDLADIAKRVRGKNAGFTSPIVYDEETPPTVTSGGQMFRFCDAKRFSVQDIILTQSFPLDYDFHGLYPKWVCGMSVPPVMMAHIASAIDEQIFKKC